MARNVDLAALKLRAREDVSAALTRYADAAPLIDPEDPEQYNLLRWIAQMTAVEIHAMWERYVEDRIVAALNHSPNYFLQHHNILGVTRVSRGLAKFVVRGGNRFFDFRSMAELLSKADQWLSKSQNPFRALIVARHGYVAREYIDALSTIRNAVVHGSDASWISYKRVLREVYNVRSAPEPYEFLHAKDTRRLGSPARGQSRLNGLGQVILDAISST